LSSKAFKNATDTSNCGAFRKATPYRMPILVQLASDEKKIGALKELLSKFDFQIQEKLKYPYFALVTKNG
jgi:hypothetical protein